MGLQGIEREWQCGKRDDRLGTPSSGEQGGGGSESAEFHELAAIQEGWGFLGIELLSRMKWKSTACCKVASVAESTTCNDVFAGESRSTDDAGFVAKCGGEHH